MTEFCHLKIQFHLDLDLPYRLDTMAPVKRTAQNVTTKKLVQKKGRKARKAAPQPKITQRTAEEVVVDNVQSFELVRCVITAAVCNFSA